jgi:alpha/beta superfamily hydrolase
MLQNRLISLNRAAFLSLLALTLVGCRGADVVVEPATPTLSLLASPTSIQSGASSMLTWSATDATACTAAGAWTGSRATSSSEAVAPVSTASYVMTCTGPGGSISGTATVVVTPAPVPQPTLTLTATPASVVQGSQSVLQWSATNATDCTASGAWTGTRAIAGSLSVTPGTTSAYALSCNGPGGSISRSVSVTVVAAPVTPTLTLVANPTTITAGGSSTLTWNSTDASSCTASGAWSGALSTSGSEPVMPTTTGTFTVTCAGTGSSIARSVTVTVQPVAAPTVTLSASPVSVATGGTSTLTWTTTNATACVASGDWQGSRATSGSAPTAALTVAATYVLTCSGAGQSVVGSVTVTVQNSTAPTADSASHQGPYTVQTYTDGIPVGSFYSVPKIWYPTDGTPPYPGVVIVPGLNGTYRFAFATTVNGVRVVQADIPQWGTLLASHGFAVMLIEMQNAGAGPSTRASGLSEAVNALAAENVRAGSPLFGKLLTDSMAVAGHSFGGAGALMLADARSNPRVKVAFGISSVPNGQMTFPNIVAPTLIIGGQGDPFSPDFLGQYNSIPATTSKMLGIVTTNSQFNDMHNVGLTPLGTHSSDPAVARYGLSFLKVYLAGDTRYAQFLVTDPALQTFRVVP